MANQNTGEIIRELRKRKGMTIANLASRAGLSTSLISQIERGETDPSIASLKRIADALEVSTATLLSDTEDVSSTVRPAGTRMCYRLQSWNVEREILGTGMKSLELTLITLPPGEKLADLMMTHSGEEAIFVLEGDVILKLDSEKYQLGPEDSAQWESHIPHMLENCGQSHARIIMADSPPFFGVKI
jgi:transcriptional regulator with XRE-family HTH domain